MSTEDNYETNYRKKLTFGGSSLLVGSLFAGPAAPIVAALGIGMIVGRAVRSLASENAKKEYEEEKASKRKENVRKEENYQEHNSYLPESPETAIARSSPQIAKSVLERIAQNNMYQEIAEKSTIMAREYLEKVKETNPERVARSDGIYISVGEDLNKGLSRFLSREKGYKINISLKENDTK
ncbi:hypothetical protein M0R72_04640 [Candidatus Pacearchaeota archaeon]|jgi:flagellar biosynthesis component FlhA|nr:hypothetical protein [Candidatus Pacearchaeota archaeon]